MFKRTTLLIGFLLAFAFAQGQETELTEDISLGFKSLLKEGSLTFSINEVVSASVAHEKIYSKISQAFFKNSEWFIEQREKQKTGLLPFHKNLGISKEEYQKLQYEPIGIAFSSIDSVSFDCKYVENYIILSTSDIDEFSSLTINLENKTLTIDTLEIPFKRFTNFTDTDNIFKSAWQGYSWEYDGFTGSQNEGVDANNSFEISFFKGSISRIKNTNEIYINLEMLGSINKAPINYKYRLLSAQI